MSNASLDIKTDQYGTPDVVYPQLYSFPMAASTKVYAGTFGATDTSGNVIATLTNASKIWGRVERQVDNTSGLAGALNCEIHPGFFYMNNDTTNAVTNASRGKACYAVDNNTVGTSDLGGSLLYAGYVVDVPASGSVEYGKVLVAVGMVNPYIVNPELAASIAASYKARNVATNLAALTFSAGSFIANANGALGAQDGITNVAGDVIFFPAGTITTGVVSAANSGPWLLTSVGGAGKFTGIRPDWWANGASVPGQSIGVAAGTLFGGTTWKSYADTLTTALVIGTDDPALYPVQVTQQVTLSSGTKTISNVPIYATARLGFAVALIGGTPAGTTTAYQKKLSSGVTAGGIGTAAFIVEAQSVAGTIVNTDVSVLNVTLING
jgi:hypothetical protein